MTTICYGLRSTSSTILNTTNASGSRVFGAGPVTPTSSAAATISIRIQHFHMLIFLAFFYPSIIDKTCRLFFSLFLMGRARC